jgi:hypothetical protein
VNIRDLIIELGEGSPSAATKPICVSLCWRLIKMKQRALLPSPEGNHSAPIIVIEKRALIRESLALCLRKEFSCPVFSFPDVDSWLKASSGSGAQLILVSARESDHEALHALGASEIGANVMVLPDATHFDDIVGSLKRGAFAGPANKGLCL